MTANYFLKCPICNSVTHMRSPAGYIAKTPVRVHCGKCDTLMTGEFISNESTSTCSFHPINCEEQLPRTQSDFYGEASGEVIVHKICPHNENPFALQPVLSPTLLCMNQIDIEVLEDYIDYACHISKLAANWDSRTILYNLLLNGKYDLIRSRYSMDAERWICNLSDEYGVQRFVHLEYLYDFGYIFGRDSLKKLLIQLNYEIIHLNRAKLKQMTDNICKPDRIHDIQSKMFKIMDGYMSIAQYIMPALSTFFFKKGMEVDKENYGISTCSFQDIKGYYLDSFESLVSCCDIIKCLDNVKYRGGYNNFGSKMDIEKFNFQTSNGNKVKQLMPTEFFSDIFGLHVDSYGLRNAIGHNDYDYNGVLQEIRYKANKQASDNGCRTYLIDIARECVSLMRSSIVLEFIVFELIREQHRTSEDAFYVHPIFYSKTGSQNHCPCGSGKKYGKCCKSWVSANKRCIQNFELPHKANMRIGVDKLMERFQISGIPSPRTRTTSRSS